MAIERSEVLKIAHLARLELTEAEIESLGTDLNNILAYVDTLSALDTGDAEGMTHAADAEEAYREDQVKPSLGADKALAIAPDAREDCFAVPKIIE